MPCSCIVTLPVRGIGSVATLLVHKGRTGRVGDLNCASPRDGAGLGVEQVEVEKRENDAEKRYGQREAIPLSGARG
jgi:hypothetical protein